MKDKKHTGPIAWMTKNSVAANLLMGLLVVGGVVVGSQIKQEVFPEFDLDYVTVGVGYPGASPAEVETGITLALEEELRGLDGVKRLTSSSGEGGSGVTIELELGVNPSKALADTKSAIDRITSFPLDAEEPIVSMLSNRQQVIQVVISGDQDEESLRQLAEQAREALLLSPDITYVDLAGVRPREIAIEVSQDDLRRYGLTLSQIAREIAGASVELPGGGIKTTAGEILVRTAERRNLGQEFADIPLVASTEGTSLRLGDIATVNDGFEDNDQTSTFNGKRAVMVNVFRSGDQTPIEIADEVYAYI